MGKTTELSSEIQPNLGSKFNIQYMHYLHQGHYLSISIYVSEICWKLY